MRLARAFRIVRHRKAHEALIADGWIELLDSTGAFPAALRMGGSGKYTDVCLHPDGSRIYVKVSERDNELIAARGSYAAIEGQQGLHGFAKWLP